MKIKILYVPTMIFLTILVSIWYIYPAYTNGVDGVKETYKQMKKENKKLLEVNAKVDNVNKLSDELVKMSEQRKLIANFISADSGEENIFANLNAIAYQTGVRVDNISVKMEKEIADKQPAVSYSEEAMLDEETGEPITVQNKPTAKDFQVEFNFTGDYSQIRSLLSKLDNLERFNHFESLSIAKPSDNGSGNVLEAKAVLNFNFYKKPLALKSVEEKAFGLTSFDLSPVSKITNEISVAMPDVVVNSQGRTNPFVQ